MVSPATAQNQTSPMRMMMLISPWPATRPPTITTVSPGAMRPTKAPVSRKAMTPTRMYVYGPSALPMSRKISSRLGGWMTPLP